MHIDMYINMYVYVYNKLGPKSEDNMVATTHRMPGRTASGGALAPQPPRTTGVGPEFPRIMASPFPPHFFSLFLRSGVSSF